MSFVRVSCHAGSLRLASWIWPPGPSRFCFRQRWRPPQHRVVRPCPGPGGSGVVGRGLRSQRCVR
eukprot:11172542-Lingulodinium_polyedra.AAC.1